MTKRMTEILDEIKEKTTQAKAFTSGDGKDVAKAEELMNAVDALQKEYEVAARIEAQSKAGVPEEGTPAETEKPSFFKAIAKMLNGKRLAETEKTALTYGGSSGESYLIPDDVRYEIAELRKQYKSAKELVTVVQTDALSGGFNYESGSPAGLSSLTDGDDVTEETAVSFVRKTFAIALYAKLIPISRIIEGAEKSGLMGYLNRWFLRNAIISENTKVFDTLAKKGAASATYVACAGWEALKTKINTGVDPDCLHDGVIVTNQTGWNLLDHEVDANCRPILSVDPANATRKMFNGLPVHVFSNSQLADVTTGTEAPMFVGSLKAGATFVEYKDMEIAVSGEALFKKNQNCMRVIEGFDCIPTDTNAYLVLKFSATPAVDAG